MSSVFQQVVEIERVRASSSTRISSAPRRFARSFEKCGCFSTSNLVDAAAGVIAS